MARERWTNLSYKYVILKERFLDGVFMMRKWAYRPLSSQNKGHGLPAVWPARYLTVPHISPNQAGSKKRCIKLLAEKQSCLNGERQLVNLGWD